MAGTSSRTTRLFPVPPAVPPSEAAPSVCPTPPPVEAGSHCNSTPPCCLAVQANAFLVAANISSPCRRYEKSRPLQDLHQAPLRALHAGMWSHILLFGQSNTAAGRVRAQLTPFQCLTSWFGGAPKRRKSKNCPDCRASVTIQPSPNYLVGAGRYEQLAILQVSDNSCYLATRPRTYVHQSSGTPPRR